MSLSQQQVQDLINQQVQGAMLQFMQQQQQQQQQHQLAVAAAAAARPKPPNLQLPQAFDGRVATLDNWLARMEQQFAWYGYAVNDHAQRIRLAVQCLSGAALDWLRNLQQQPTVWEAAAGQPSFVSALRARFQPVTSADSARMKLHSLAQGKQSVQEYVSSFRSLLPKVPDMAEPDRLFSFLRGLQPSIAAQLRIHNVQTVEAAVEMAVRIGCLKEMHAPGAGASAAASASDAMDLSAMLDGVEGLEADSSDTPAAVTHAELQMLIAALQDSRRAKGAAGGMASAGGNRRFQRGPGGPPRIPHLTPEQVKEHMDAGKCFGCGSLDHRSRACPKRKIGVDGRVSWTN